MRATDPPRRGRFGYSPRMALGEGQSVGVFTITGRIGAGGMGQVWRAHDTRLDRDVAIKTLPDAVSRDPEQLASFEREAKILAALNHPHIATVHGLGQTDDGEHYLVLELVDGVPLSTKLAAGALPADECAAIAGQVAEALEAAHQRGVIHRDLKPANIMVSPSGWVKVLDFGLARRAETAAPAVAGGTLEMMPTMAAATMAAVTMATGAGGGISGGTSEVSGTPGYMSPEQVLGSEQDARTDVFALGCGPNLLAIASKIIAQDPDWALLPADTPPWMRALLTSMLAKAAAARPASMREIREACSVSGSSRSGTMTRIARDAALAAIPRNLPREASSFVGRAQEVAQCVAQLAQTRVVTLTGVGGCGKTRLALRVAAHVLEDASAPDGVWFVDLGALSDDERVADVTAVALGVTVEHGQRAIDRLVEFLRDRRALIALDNCEHLLAACAELVDVLLDGCEGVRVLATSREPLGVRGEVVHAVPSLSLPPRSASVDRATAEACEAVQLFVARARQVVPDFALSDATAPLVVEICRRLDGIPLALELAAARVKVLTLDQIRAKLEDRFRLLTGGSRTALPRHQTLRATLQWSYDHLAEPERELLHALAACAGGWTLEAATALSGDDADEFDVLDILTRLVDKSLVVVDHSDNERVRYRFLESVRQYAVECASAAGHLVPARVRHLGFFLAMAEAAYWKLWSAEQSTWVRILETEHENMLEALGTCETAEEGGQKALRLAAALRVWWDIRGYATIGRRELRVALDRPTAQERTVARAKALYGIGWLSIRQADFAAARAAFTESLDVFTAHDDKRGLSAALSGLASVARCGSGTQDELEEARDYYGRALALSREIGDQPSTAASLNNLGDVALQLGDLARARALFEESAALYETIGEREYRAAALHNLGWVCVQLDDAAAARRALAASVDLLRAGGGRASAAWTIEYAAYLARRVGDATQAARFLGAAATVRRETGGAFTPAESALHDDEVGHLRAPLGDAPYETAAAAGAVLPYEAALAELAGWLAAG